MPSPSVPTNLAMLRDPTLREPGRRRHPTQPEPGLPEPTSSPPAIAQQACPSLPDEPCQLTPLPRPTRQLIPIRPHSRPTSRANLRNTPRRLIPCLSISTSRAWSRTTCATPGQPPPTSQPPPLPHAPRRRLQPPPLPSGPCRLSAPCSELPRPRRLVNPPPYHPRPAHSDLPPRAIPGSHQGIPARLSFPRCGTPSPLASGRSD